MRDVIDELLAREDVTPTDPASRNDINAVGKEIDAPIPESLTKLWRVSDGVTLDSLDARIPGPAEVLQILTEDEWDNRWAQSGLLPVLDDNQSNYLGVFVRGARAFRVAHLPHDDGSRLLYRDFESCAAVLIEAAERGDTADVFFFETKGDYPPDAPRPEEDQEAAKTLLAEPHQLDEWNHAAQLLDASNLDEWARLLETDHFVRRDVRDRMKKMSSPAIRELLRKDEKAFEEFAELADAVARKAGLKVGRREQDTLQVGGKWMNLDAFFYRRHIPNALPRMVAWFEDAVAGRDPHDRSGHFMSD